MSPNSERQLARRRVTRAASLFVIIIWLHIRAVAQEADPGSRSEFWPELDVFVPINENWRLLVTTSITKAEETKENQEFQIGARIDYLTKKRLVFGGGYSFRHSPGNDPSNEHRLAFDQTFRYLLPLTILLSDRNREEIRIVDGNGSFRYRNRLMFEREFRVKERSVTPYGSVEVFHDSRFDVWNRNRLTAGVQIQLKHGAPLLDLIHQRNRLVLEPYYARQHDSRSAPHSIHAIGVTFSIYF